MEERIEYQFCCLQGKLDVAISLQKSDHRDEKVVSRILGARNLRGNSVHARLNSPELIHSVPLLTDVSQQNARSGDSLPTWLW